VEHRLVDADGFAEIAVQQGADPQPVADRQRLVEMILGAQELDDLGVAVLAGASAARTGTAARPCEGPQSTAIAATIALAICTTILRWRTSRSFRRIGAGKPKWIDKIDTEDGQRFMSYRLPT